VHAFQEREIVRDAQLFRCAVALAGTRIRRLRHGNAVGGATTVTLTHAEVRVDTLPACHTPRLTD
jgi:hypothetical protein